MSAKAHNITYPSQALAKTGPSRFRDGPAYPIVRLISVTGFAGQFKSSNGEVYGLPPNPVTISISGLTTLDESRPCSDA